MNRGRAIASALAIGLLVAPLAACAPEPGAAQSQQEKTTDPSKKQEPEGGSWPEKNPDEVYEKHTEIPADFPAEFVVPQGADIDDAGARGGGVWYLVLRATDAADADALWNDVIAEGSFTASDELTTAEGGRAATLTGATLRITAMTLPQSDGSVLVSYDITRTAG